MIKCKSYNAKPDEVNEIPKERHKNPSLWDVAMEIWRYKRSMVDVRQVAGRKIHAESLCSVIRSLSADLILYNVR